MVIIDEKTFLSKLEEYCFKSLCRHSSENGFPYDAKIIKDEAKVLAYDRLVAIQRKCKINRIPVSHFYRKFADTYFDKI